MNPIFDWSTVSDHSLAQLARDYSASQIAQQLGCSRNAVIGRCARRGIRLSRYLAPRVEPIVRAATRRATDRQRYHAKRAKVFGLPPAAELMGVPVAPAPVLEPIAKPETAGVSIMGLRDGLCRWPLWETDAPSADKRYCGSKTEEGRVYCAHCATIAYSPRRTESLDKKLGIFRLPRAA